MPTLSEEGLFQRRFSVAHRRTAGSSGEDRAQETILGIIALGDEQAIEWLTNWRWPNGVMCPNCEGAEFYDLRSRTVGGANYRRCKSCRTDFAWSTGTILASRKASPQIYVAAITCASDRLCSANFFAAVAGMNPRAAVILFQKIRCMDA